MNTWEKKDKKLYRLNKNLKNILLEQKHEEKKKQERIHLSENILIEKRLTEENVMKVKQTIWFLEDSVLLSKFFVLTVEDLKEEYDNTGSIRDCLLDVLDTIIAREDFHLFDSLKNLDAFRDLYALCDIDNIHLEAILRYLSSSEFSKRQVMSSFGKIPESELLLRLNQYCGVIVNHGDSIGEYVKKVTRQKV